MGAPPRIVEYAPTYGKWTVLGWAESIRYKRGLHRALHVRCECGHEAVIGVYQLRNGGSQGCRRCAQKCWPQFGDRYGRLVVTEAETTQEWGSSRGRRACVVRCDCGATRTVRQSDLTSGRLSSCGCAKHEGGARAKSWRGHGEIPASLMTGVRRGAGVRGLPCEVTIEYLWTLFLKQDRRCALTGRLLEFGRRTGCTASLDRIDSSVGYVDGNVQWVHKVVNIMKQGLADAELVGWCREIVAHADIREGVA